MTVNWEAAILETGVLNLPKVFSFVIIRLFQIGEVKVEAEGSKGSELVDWAEGSIAVIKNALRVRISGTGKLVGSCVSYKMPALPTP